MPLRWTDRVMIELPRTALYLNDRYCSSNSGIARRLIGMLSIDNNAARRATRACKIGRKNWLFCGFDSRGARSRCRSR